MVGFGGQGGCEQRSEAFVKIKKKYGGGGIRLGEGQGGSERRSEVFVKNSKDFIWGGGGGGESGGGVRSGVGMGRGVARFGVGG